MSGHVDFHNEHHVETHTSHVNATSASSGRFKQGLKNAGNLADNLISTPFRVGGIVANTTLDLADTFNNLSIRSGEIRKNTIQQMRDVLSESGRGSFWKRLLKVPVGAGLAIGKGIEGTVRSVVTPLWHGVRDVVGTAKNLIFNTGRAATYIPNINPADTYKFDKLAAREYEKKGWDWMKLMPRRKDDATTRHDSTHDGHSAPVVAIPDPSVVALQEKLTKASEGSHNETGVHEPHKEAIVAKKHEEHPKEEHPKEEHPKEEHPKEEHPKEEHPKEEHPKEEHPKDHKEDHAGVDAMKKDADIVRDKLTKVLPKDYEISWDEVSTGKFKGMQKITALHKDKEKKHDPEVIITVYEPGKVRVRYNPQKDHGSIKDLHYSYYLGETTIDALDTCLSAVAGVISPGDGKKPDFHILEAVGLKKEGEDATKHGYEEGEGPFGKNDQNKDHHKKEREEKGADHKDEKKEDDHHH